MEIINNGIGPADNDGYNRVDKFDDDKTSVLTGLYKQVLDALGEDVRREGLDQTPLRVAKSMQFLTQGYGTDPDQLISQALFREDYNEMVIVKDIEFYSLCEHHMLPFYGHAHVAYIPDGKVIGLSKIPRIVDMFARRLQVQERMTKQIADFIKETIQPKGVAVVVDGVHMCSMMRGVKKASASMVTSTVLDAFRNNPKTRAEFMQHISGRKSID